MKKKLFDGKLKDPIGFVVALTIISGCWVFLAIVMIFVIFFGDNIARDKIIMGIFAGVALLFGIGHPILFTHVVKDRKKYPRLSKRLVKPGSFIDE